MKKNNNFKLGQINSYEIIYYKAINISIQRWFYVGEAMGRLNSPQFIPMPVSFIAPRKLKFVF